MPYLAHDLRCRAPLRYLHRFSYYGIFLLTLKNTPPGVPRQYEIRFFKGAR